MSSLSVQGLQAPRNLSPVSFKSKAAAEIVLESLKFSGMQPANPATIRWRGVLAKCKLHWQAAISVLRTMVLVWVEPDVTHRNAVLSASVVSQEWQQSTAAFERISQQNSKPDIVSVTTMMGLASERWAFGLDMLLLLDLNGLQMDRIACCEVMKSHKRFSLWTLSLLNLARMSETNMQIDSVSCAHFMSACSDCSQWRLTLRAVSWMAKPESPCETGLLPFNIVQSSYGHSEWEYAAVGLEQARHSRLHPDEVSLCVTLKKQSHQHWSLATGVFTLCKMRSWNVRPNINCFNCAMATIAHICTSSNSSNSGWSRVLEFLRSVQQQLIFPDTVTLNTCLAAFRSLGSPEKWAVPLCLIHAASIQPDAVTWLCVMEPLEFSESSWRKAIQLLRQLPVLQLRPSAHCASVVMKCCKSMGLWRLSLDLLSGLADQNDRSAATATCAVASCWQLAMYLTSIERWRLQQDVISLNSGCSVLERSSAWSHAWALLEYACKRGIELTQESHRQSMSCGSSRWVQALVCWTRHRACFTPFTPETDIASCNAALSATEKAALWYRTLELWKTMCTCHIQPDEISYNAVISYSAASV